MRFLISKINFIIVFLRSCYSDELSIAASLLLLLTLSRSWISFSKPSIWQKYMYKSLSSYAWDNNFILAFSFVISSRQSLGNYWVRNCIKMFLYFIVAVLMFLSIKIRMTLDVCFIYNATRYSRHASACLSWVQGLTWPASSFLRI